MSRSQPLSTGGKPPENGDLTNILDFGRKLEEKGLFPKLGDGGSDQGSVMEEPHRVKLDEFEDLDSIGLMDHPEPTLAPESQDLANPTVQNLAAEPETFLESIPQAEPQTHQEVSASSLEATPIAIDDADFPTSTPESPPASLLSSPPQELFSPPPIEAPESDIDFTPSPEPTGESASHLPPEPGISTLAPSPELSEVAINLPEAPVQVEPPAPIPAHAVNSPSDSSLKTLQEPIIQAPKKLERAVDTAPTIRAPQASLQTTDEALLFHLQITGPLSGAEKNRITDFLRRESSLGIRPEDIKLQLETGNLLLPRLSEYAITLLVQLLRSSQADIRILPATASPSKPPLPETNLALHQAPAVPLHEWDRLPLETIETPASMNEDDLGLLSATALIPVDGISGRMAGPSASEDYPAALERLEREIQSRARVKKADKVTDFKISWEAISADEANVLSSVAASQRFRHGAWKITATGRARRARR